MKLKVFFIWLVSWTAAVYGDAIAQTKGGPSDTSAVSRK